MRKQIILVYLLLKLTRSSRVIDFPGQRVLKISDYCPDTPLCPEGSHIMCSYQSSQRFGPRCANPQPKATMNAKMSQLYLDIVNMIRSEAANGKAIGKGKLPRAFGVMRLKWDEELATFAQTLADQCVLRHDLCRGSEKFPNPGQTIGYIHLTLNDWQPIRNKKKILPKSLTDETMEYAIQNILKTAYDTKANIVPNDIYQVPEFQKNQAAAAKKMYFQLVSRSSHVGCGLSAFGDVKVQVLSRDRKGPIKYGRQAVNVLLLVCNYAEDVKAGTSIYDTTPRTDSSAKCGCPKGTWEDENCLCNEMLPAATTTVATTTLKCSPNNASPTVVLLPIVTVEDAPADKLFDSNGAVRSSNLDLFDDLAFPFIQKDRNPEHHDLPEIPLQSHEDNHAKSYSDPLQLTNRAKQEQAHREYLASKKSSIFSRAPQFRLPNHVKDVLPRRDYSNIQNEVNNYFKMKNDHQKKPFIDNVDDVLSKVTEKNLTDFNRDTTLLYNVEDRVMNEPDESNINNHKMDVQSRNNDHKLMVLLDTLEKEVQKVELDSNKRELLDAKLRKIYGTVVGKPVQLPIEHNTEDKINNKFEDFKKYDQYDTNFVTDHKSRYLLENKFENKNFSNDEIINERLEKQLNERSYEFDEYDDDIKAPRPWKYKDIELNYEMRNRNSEDGNRLPQKEEPLDRYKYRNCDKINAYKLRDVKTSRYLHPISRNNRNYREGKRTKSSASEALLSKDRRKYYQDKLDAIEKKLQATHRRKVSDHLNKRQTRKILPDAQTRRSKGRFDELYLPDRAKYLQGF